MGAALLESTASAFLSKFSTTVLLLDFNNEGHTSSVAYTALLFDGTMTSQIVSCLHGLFVKIQSFV